MNLIKNCWKKEDYEDFLNYLVSLKNYDYQKFNEKLIKTKYQILGIKFPVLRSIAKEINKGDYKSFLENITDTYFEEVFIYGLISLNDNTYFTKYLDKIDNWALCDSYVISQKFILKDKDKYFNSYLQLLSSPKTYYIRVGLVTLLNFYMDYKYIEEILNSLSNIKNDDYYVLMGEAWLLQVMSINNSKLVINYLNKHNNPKLIKMTINKIRDSYKFSKETKKEIIFLLKSML